MATCAKKMQTSSASPSQFSYFISGNQFMHLFYNQMQQNDKSHGLSLSPDLDRLKRKLIKPSVFESTPTPTQLKPSLQLKLRTEQTPIYALNKREEETQKRFKNLQSSESVINHSKVEIVENKIRHLMHEREKHILPAIGNIRRMLKYPKKWQERESAVLKNYVDENLLNRIALGKRISRVQSKEQVGNVYEDSISGYLKREKEKRLVYYKPEQIRKRGSVEQPNSRYNSKDQTFKKRSSQPRSSKKNIGLSGLLKKNRTEKKIVTQRGEEFNFFELRTQFTQSSITLMQIYTLKEQQEDLMLNNIHHIPIIPPKEQMKEFLQSYQPANDEINIIELAKSNFCAVEYNQKELFIGEMVGKKKSGVGILITHTSCFEGVWKNNQRVRGVEITTEGIYKGGYVNDYRQGRGQFEWYRGEMYVGEWKRGLKHGDGLWINPRGDSYNGQWKNDKIQGIGTFVLKNVEETHPDRKYKGSFLNFRKHGFGRENFENGDFFEGIYKEDRPQGRGLYRWANGSLFQGEFDVGRRHGMGILKTPFKLTYKGEFVNDKPEGECEIVLPNGDVYYGMVRDGRKNGKGTLQLKASSEVFNGYWKNDYFVSEAEENQ